MIKSQQSAYRKNFVLHDEIRTSFLVISMNYLAPPSSDICKFYYHTSIIKIENRPYYIWGVQKKEH